MKEPLIPGGYILLSRKIIESEIWNKPPLYLKVWIYLLSIAQHKNYKNLKRGQAFTSIPEIIEACSWKVGYRTEKPTKDQIFQVLEWLRNGRESNDESNDSPTMIATTKATHGIIVTIDKYDFYQNPKNYESNNVPDDENETKAEREQRQPDNINKNVNNDKNNKNDIKKDILSIFDYWNSKKIKVHRELTKKRESAIHARLQKYSIQTILEAIDNYYTILTEDKYYLTYKWTLEDFLNPTNIDKFITENDPFSNYLKHEFKKGGVGYGSRPRNYQRDESIDELSF